MPRLLRIANSTSVQIFPACVPTLITVPLALPAYMADAIAQTHLACTLLVIKLPIGVEAIGRPINLAFLAFSSPDQNTEFTPPFNPAPTPKLNVIPFKPQLATSLKSTEHCPFFAS